VEMLLLAGPFLNAEKVSDNFHIVRTIFIKSKTIRNKVAKILSHVYKISLITILMFLILLDVYFKFLAVVF